MDLDRKSARILAGEGGFPAALTGIGQPARALWYRGRLPRPGERLVAIVGARAASLAGCRQATALAAAAVRLGYGVVSGGALGIDAAAHRGALEAGGATFAVLGCGIDVVYPDRHVALFDEIAARGGLISEYAPGTEPRRGQFPARNRLVSALAEAVIVVEAGGRSGALGTARLARRQRRLLLAVPGSPGTDALLAKGGARPVEGDAGLARALAGEAAPAPVAPRALAPLLAALGRGEARPAELAARLAASLPETLALLAEAELDGWVLRLPGGAFASLEEVSRAS
jgi:DNA processing protein